jgi:hypothetical protein
MGQTVHQVLGLKYKPSPMARVVEMIHMLRNTPPMAWGSPQAMKSRVDMKDIMTVNNNQRNQLDFKNDGMGLLKLTRDKKRS